MTQKLEIKRYIEQSLKTRKNIQGLKIKDLTVIKTMYACQTCQINLNMLVFAHNITVKFILCSGNGVNCGKAAKTHSRIRKSLSVFTSFYLFIVFPYVYIICTCVNVVILVSFMYVYCFIYLFIFLLLKAHYRSLLIHFL